MTPWIPIVQVDWHTSGDDGTTGWSLQDIPVDALVFAEDDERDEGRLARVDEVRPTRIVESNSWQGRYLYTLTFIETFIDGLEPPR